MSNRPGYWSQWYRRRKIENPEAHAAWMARNAPERKPRQEHPRKQLILLLLALGDTFGEIAEELGTTRGVVAGVVYRARKGSSADKQDAIAATRPEAKVAS